MRLEAGPAKYEISCRIRVFCGEVLLPELLKLVPWDAGLSLVEK